MLTKYIHFYILNLIFESSPKQNFKKKDDLRFPRIWKLSLALVCKDWSDVIDALYGRYIQVVNFNRKIELGTAAYSNAEVSVQEFMPFKIRDRTLENHDMWKLGEVQIVHPTNFFIHFNHPIEKVEHIKQLNQFIDGLIRHLEAGVVLKLQILLFDSDCLAYARLIPHLNKAESVQFEIRTQRNMESLYTLVDQIANFNSTHSDQEQINLRRLNIQDRNVQQDQMERIYNRAVECKSLRKLDTHEFDNYIHSTFATRMASYLATLDINFPYSSDYVSFDFSFLSEMKQLSKLTIQIYKLQDATSLWKVLTGNQTITNLNLSEIEVIPDNALNLEVIKKLSLQVKVDWVPPAADKLLLIQQQQQQYQPVLSLYHLTLRHSTKIIKSLNSRCSPLFSNIRHLDLISDRGHFNDFSFILSPECKIETLTIEFGNEFDYHFQCIPLFSALAENRTITSFRLLYDLITKDDDEIKSIDHFTKTNRTIKTLLTNSYYTDRSTLVKSIITNQMFDNITTSTLPYSNNVYSPNIIFIKD